MFVGGLRTSIRSATTTAATSARAIGIRRSLFAATSSPLQRTARRNLSAAPVTLPTPPPPPIIFISGGPGSGKGTQCAKLAAEFGLTHFSAGDLLRKELTVNALNKQLSPNGELIRKSIAAGQILPASITVTLLKDAIDRIGHSTVSAATAIAGTASVGGGAANHPNRAWLNRSLIHATSEAERILAEMLTTQRQAVVLVDGFPRSMENLKSFEKAFSGVTEDGGLTAARAMITLTCPNTHLKDRLRQRSKLSGRSDDLEGVYESRFNTFQRETAPVIRVFATDPQRCLRTIDATHSIDKVYTQFKEAFFSIITFLREKEIAAATAAAAAQRR